MPAPLFAQAPPVRALLRTLLFAAAVEAVFYRLLTIPPDAAWWPRAAELHASTGRAGALMFLVAFALLLPTILVFVIACLRRPAWPGGLNSISILGLLAAAVLGMSAALGPRGPAFAFGFTLLVLLVGLAMLAGMYESRTDAAGRAFAVTLAGAFACTAASTSEALLARLGLVEGSPALEAGALEAGRWLLFAAGVLSFPAFGAAERVRLTAPMSAASLGFSTASAFTVVLGGVTHPRLLSRLDAALGHASPGAVSGILSTSAAAAAVFLVTLAAFTGFEDERSRPRSYGLLFVLLAGFPQRVAYQHLLSLVGVALLTAEEPPPASPAPAEAALETPPARDA